MTTNRGVYRRRLTLHGPALPCGEHKRRAPRHTQNHDEEERTVDSTDGRSFVDSIAMRGSDPLLSALNREHNKTEN